MAIMATLATIPVVGTVAIAATRVMAVFGIRPRIRPIPRRAAIAATGATVAINTAV